MDRDYEYPRETQELVYFKEISIDGASPELPMEYSLTRGLERPTTWGTIEKRDGRFAFFLDGTLPSGEYQVYVRVSGSGERPIIQAGRIRLT